MRTALLLLPLAIGLALSSAPARSAESIEKVNGAIHAETGHEYARLETVNGSIEIDAGVQTGSAETVNGAIDVGSAAQTGALETVNGSLRLGANASVGGNISTVNGGVFIDRGGAISGNVETVNGAVGLVATNLTGSVETSNGDITVGVDSHVHGGIHVQKRSVGFFNFGVRRRDPRIVIGPRAQVDGALLFERPVTLFVHDSAHIGTVTGAVVKRYSGATAPGR